MAQENQTEYIFWSYFAPISHSILILRLIFLSNKHQIASFYSTLELNLSKNQCYKPDSRFRVFCPLLVSTWTAGAWRCAIFRAKNSWAPAAQVLRNRSFILFCLKWNYNWAEPSNHGNWIIGPVAEKEPHYSATRGNNQRKNELFSVYLSWI